MHKKLDSILAARGLPPLRREGGEIPFRPDRRVGPLALVEDERGVYIATCGTLKDGCRPAVAVHVLIVERRWWGGERLAWRRRAVAPCNVGTPTLRVGDGLELSWAGA